MQIIVHLANQADRFFADESGSSFTEAMLIALIAAAIFWLGLLAVGIGS